MTETNDDTRLQEVVEIKASELPAYCPTEQMGLWNSHPRVYIPLEEQKDAKCPYCGTQFSRVDESGDNAAE